MVLEEKGHTGFVGKNSRSFEGMAMIEVLIGILILSFGLIPIYSIFTSSRKTVFKSELSYLALNVAREKMDEVQLLPLSKIVALAGETPSWKPCLGNSFELLTTDADKLEDPAPMDGTTQNTQPTKLIDDQYNYPENYKRIFVNLKIEPLNIFPGTVNTPVPSQWDPHLFKIIVKVRWQEKGESVAGEESKNTKPFKSHFERIISVGGSAERDLK